MRNTKHDLNAEVAKLNLTELKSALLFGGRHAQTEVERAIGQLQNSKTHLERMCAAQRLSEATTALNKITTSVYYLDEANSRDEIEVIKETE
jgi:hypothetical protein